jgi:Peptidase family M20/M25/M40
MVGRGLVLWTSFGAALWGQQIRWPPYQDEAVRLLQEYLRVDTQNPPGNELSGAQFFHRLFDQAGIPNTIYEFEPGRANVYARLKGDGSQRPLILLNHLDTVRADSSQWKAPPLSGQILDGELYGRGALDMKGLGLLQAMTLLVAVERARAAAPRPDLPGHGGRGSRRPRQRVDDPQPSGTATGCRIFADRGRFRRALDRRPNHISDRLRRKSGSLDQDDGDRTGRARLGPDSGFGCKSPGARGASCDRVADACPAASRGGGVLPPHRAPGNGTLS